MRKLFQLKRLQWQSWHRGCLQMEDAVVQGCVLFVWGCYSTVPQLRINLDQTSFRAIENAIETKWSCGWRITEKFLIAASALPYPFHLLRILKGDPQQSVLGWRVKNNKGKGMCSRVGAGKRWLNTEGGKKQNQRNEKESHLVKLFYGQIRIQFFPPPHLINFCPIFNLNWNLCAN